MSLAVRPRAAILLAGLVAASGSLPACGSRSEPAAAPPVKLDQIGDAVRAVEAELGGSQRYSEINATPSEVNLFVVDPSGAETAWVYHDGRLDPPPTGPATALPDGATTFAAADVAFEPDAVLDRVGEALAGSTVVAFSVQPGGQGTQLVATLASDKGGGFRVLLAPDGQILGAEPEPAGSP